MGKRSPVTEELWTESWLLLGEGESVFFKGVASGMWTMLQCTAPHSGVYAQHNSYYKKKTQIGSDRKVRVDGKGVGGRVEDERNSLHTMLKELIDTSHSK